ncbi:MAG: hypothetical protein COS95_01050 [Ignavibacteriales bacterium CG07_land_8_20_14_0_80_59_12]|nr:MAG: hypothetical protein COS95_01050 [Ignavibacteriales bacterium CG07_land_8_20_14_0_80_59_12]
MTRRTHISAAPLRRLLDLKPILRFLKSINQSDDLSFILSDLLLTLMGKLLYRRGAVVRESRDGKLVIAIAKGMPGVNPGMPVREEADTAGEGTTLAELGLSEIFPLRTANCTLGYVGLGGRAMNDELSPDEQEALNILLEIAASAIERGLFVDELRDANRALGLKVQQLNTLFDLGKEFAGLVSRPQIVKLFGFGLMGQLGVQQFAVALFEREQWINLGGRWGALPAGTVLKELSTLGRAVALETLPSGSLSDDALRALTELSASAVVPMPQEEHVKGLVLLGKPVRKGSYSASDLEFLYALVSITAGALENAVLFEEAVERKRLEEELWIAHSIQEQLLPTTFPHLERLDIGARCISSKQVGGDYFDLIRIDDDHLVVAVADVSGKGVPGAILMANLQAAVHTIVDEKLDLVHETRRINEMIFDNTPVDRFITFFWGIIDTRYGFVRYVNAGHNQPIILRRDGVVERLEAGGLILGVLRDGVYEMGESPFGHDDTLVLFTDGVTEAVASSGEEFGEERLISLINSLSGRPAAEIADGIQCHVAEFASGMPQADDITVVVLKGS